MHLILAMILVHYGSSIMKLRTSKCQCGNDLGGIVKCNYDKEGAQENAIMECYCMTHDEKSGIVLDVSGQPSVIQRCLHLWELGVSLYKEVWSLLGILRIQSFRGLE